MRFSSGGRCGYVFCATPSLTAGAAANSATPTRSPAHAIFFRGGCSFQAVPIRSVLMGDLLISDSLSTTVPADKRNTKKRGAPGNIQPRPGYRFKLENELAAELELSRVLRAGGEAEVGIAH